MRQLLHSVFTETGVRARDAGLLAGVDLFDATDQDTAYLVVDPRMRREAGIATSFKSSSVWMRCTGLTRIVNSMRARAAISASSGSKHFFTGRRGRNRSGRALSRRLDEHIRFWDRCIPGSDL